METECGGHAGWVWRTLWDFEMIEGKKNLQVCGHFQS